MMTKIYELPCTPISFFLLVIPRSRFPKQAQTDRGVDPGETKDSAVSTPHLCATPSGWWTVSKDHGQTLGTGEGSAQRTGKLHSVKESKYLFSGGMHPSSTIIPSLLWLPSLISININTDDKKTYWKDLREEQTRTHYDKNKPGANDFALEEWPWHCDLPRK